MNARRTTEQVQSTQQNIKCGSSERAGIRSCCMPSFSLDDEGSDCLLLKRKVLSTTHLILGISSIALTAAAITGVLYVRETSGKYVFMNSVTKTPMVDGTLVDNHYGHRSPAEYGIDFEEVAVANYRPSTGPAGILKGWFLKQEDADTHNTIVFFHGVAGNIGSDLPVLVALYRASNCNVLAMDYRGYGPSSGIQVSAATLEEDAKVILDHALAITGKNLILVGHSMGCSPALIAAGALPGRGRVQGLILAAPYTKLTDAIKEHVPKFLRAFVPALFKHDLDNVELIGHVPEHLPLLILAGDKDKLCKPYMAKMLYTTLRADSKEAGLLLKTQHRLFDRVCDSRLANMSCVKDFWEHISNFILRAGGNQHVPKIWGIDFVEDDESISKERRLPFDGFAKYTKLQQSVASLMARLRDSSGVT